jgi:hypothetical protein
MNSFFIEILFQLKMHFVATNSELLPGQKSTGSAVVVGQPDESLNLRNYFAIFKVVIDQL